MTGDTNPPPGWVPPRGELPWPVAAGVHWDAVRIGDRAVTHAVLARLGRDTGAVIQDGRTGVAYWLVRPHAADSWPAVTGVSVLGRGDLVAVPPVWLTHGPGPHWRVPFSADAHLTDQDRLRGALAAAMGRLGAPEADEALTRLSAAQRARRNAVLSARLREVNHRSVTREVRPW